MPSQDAAGLTLAAPAKINLYLDVLGRRADGYHEVVTCMAPIALADELTFTPAESLSLTCDDPSVPLDESNLVLRAVRLLQQRQISEGREDKSAPPGARIHLRKRIPMAAGLGGGSSDAATTLAALNQLWHLRLSAPTLLQLAAQLGSDVPFFLSQSAAWCRGRGEQITPIQTAGVWHLLLMAPIVGLGTAAVYQALQAPHWNLSRGADKPAGEEALPERARRLQEALEHGDGQELGAALFNRLQEPAERLLPLVAEVRQLLEGLAPEQLFWGHQMSGSGSSYFVVCRGQTEAQRLARLVTTRWAGGVLNTGMGTAEPKDGPPERTIRLFVTSILP